MRRAVLASTVLLALVAPARVTAQQTRLTIAGWPLTVAQTTGADFDQGFVLLGSTTILIEALGNPHPLQQRITTVDVQCAPACPRSGTLPLAGLQWRRDDQAGWTTLSTSFVTVESRQITSNGANDPWTQTMHWRYVLSWAANAPAGPTQFNIVYRLVVTAP